MCLALGALSERALRFGGEAPLGAGATVTAGEERGREGQERSARVRPPRRVRSGERTSRGHDSRLSSAVAGGEAAAAALEKEDPALPASQHRVPGPHRGQASGSCPRPVRQGLPLARGPSQRPRRRRASGFRREGDVFPGLETS